MRVRTAALTYPSFGMRAPLLSVMGDGWRHGDRVAYLFRPLKYGHDAFSQTGLFSNSVFTKAEKAICFASVKEPDTAYSNRLPGTVHF